MTIFRFMGLIPNFPLNVDFFAFRALIRFAIHPKLAMIKAIPLAEAIGLAILDFVGLAWVAQGSAFGVRAFARGDSSACVNPLEIVSNVEQGFVKPDCVATVATMPAAICLFGFFHGRSISGLVGFVKPCYSFEDDENVCEPICGNPGTLEESSDCDCRKFA